MNTGEVAPIFHTKSNSGTAICASNAAAQLTHQNI